MLNRLVLLTSATLCLGAGAAFALPDVGIGFDPSQASPGDQVHFFFSLDNIGTETRQITVQTTLQFGDFTLGPFTRRVTLGAGQGHAIEFDFVIPQHAPAGTLTITSTASDVDGSDTAQASLEIIAPRGTPAAEKGMLDVFSKELAYHGMKDEVK